MVWGEDDELIFSLASSCLFSFCRGVQGSLDRWRISEDTALTKKKLCTLMILCLLPAGILSKLW